MGTMPTGGLAGSADFEPTVLVVDDDLAYREAVGRMLAQSGYAVSEAANGEEALGLLRSGVAAPPQLIVLDLRMPVMTGWTFLKIVDADRRWNRIPILVASASRPELNASADVGPRVWLPKPLDPDVLLDLASTHARRRS